MKFKERVWYSAWHNEILIETEKYRVERGCQALMKSDHCPNGVPDYFSFFSWKIDPSTWIFHEGAGMLIDLGEL